MVDECVPITIIVKRLYKMGHRDLKDILKRLIRNVLNNLKSNEYINNNTKICSQIPGITPSMTAAEVGKKKIQPHILQLFKFVFERFKQEQQQRQKQQQTCFSSFRKKKKKGHRCVC